MITKPGIYDIPAAEYHADPCPTPSLSASIAHELLTCSPRHAWQAHPRLNPAHQREDDEKFELGTASHAYLLEGEAGFVIVDAPDWRTKAAKEARDAARAAGMVPLLAHRWADVQAMAETARRQLAAHQDPPTPLTAGKPERTLIWQEEGGIWCRARLDWLHDAGDVIDDYKTTSASANPDVWTRSLLWNMGYDVQAAFYLRGLKAVTGVDAHFRFVAQENFPPFALAIIGLGPMALALAERKVRAALAAWRFCLETDTWPGYPQHTCWADAPPWAEAQWMEREGREPAPVVDDGRSLADQLIGGGP